MFSNCRAAVLTFHDQERNARMSQHTETGEVRFPFGDNWASYSEVVTDDRLDQAERDLLRLVGDDCELAGRRFLDIG